MADERRYTVLVAEDDGDIRLILKLYLESGGYHVLLAENGREALDLARSEMVDLALLDIMMPGIDGYRVMEKIRESSNIPVLFLTAKDQDFDRILGLNLGADMYLTKPFHPLEVVAQVQASLRRFYRLGSGVRERSRTLAGGGLLLDLDRMRLEKDGVLVELTPTEFRILAKLMQSPGRVFTRAQLYESACDGFPESDDRTMMVHISRLREKLEEDGKEPRYIRTVRGIGYKIEYKEASGM